MTKREAERRERFWLYDDFGDADREKMRRLYFGDRAEPVDIADQFDTDMATVFKVITSTPLADRLRLKSK
jgi:hypothetical protein